eukprot:scaffold63172_cov27-Tisochrysis_lutea.AAC.5
MRASASEAGLGSVAGQTACLPMWTPDESASHMSTQTRVAAGSESGTLLTPTRCTTGPANCSN